MLTPKQQMFVKEYLIDLNATQAAIRAGYSMKTARSQGQRLLTKVDVQGAITEAQTQRAERVDINSDYVLTTIKDTIDAIKRDPDNQATAIFKGCELLGKHLKLFTDKVEHSVQGELADVLRAARERCNGRG
jgi:phage terminase small subunit